MRRRFFGAAAVSILRKGRALFMRKYLVAAACAVVGTLAIAGSAFAIQTVITPNGIWKLHPGQSTAYEAAVQQPIDSGNTSNWTLKSKGAIPIMFKLSSGVGPLLFDSIYSDNGTDTTTGSPCATGHINDCALAQFRPTTRFAFSDLANLSANYLFTVGDCYGGSLRWDIAVIHNGSPQIVEVYYGNPNADNPPTQSCSGSYDESGKNLMDASDATLPPNRFEMLGGWGADPVPPLYTTYASALASTNNGTDLVYAVQLTLDSGWSADQRVTLGSATLRVGGTGGYTDTFTPQPASALAATCNLPEAHLRVTRKDPTPDGPVNEEPVQAPLVDSGDTFRTVDCKYMYNLSVPKLVATGPGTYQIEILIDGTPVPTPGSLNGKVLIDVRG